MLSLKRHPASAGGESFRVGAAVRRAPGGVLTLRYEVGGPVGDLALPAPASPERTNGLWRHTCFEAFAAAPHGDGYCELNFAPSGQWAAYAFTGYRVGMAAAEIAAPRIECRGEDERFTLEVAVTLGRLGEGPWRLGLSAVLEDRQGRISYWALAHPPGKPDFHHRDGFAHDLPATDS